MKFKNYFIAFLLTGIILAVFLIEKSYSKVLNNANVVYKVYLKGEELGTIQNKNELLTLINEEQKEIKKKYDVKNVYPPASLNIIKTSSFNDEFTEVNEIYKKIEEEDAFTVKGYKVLIKNEETETTINVLKKSDFENATRLMVSSFVDEEQLELYLNNEQKEIEDTGEIIEATYFEEDITIKESYLDVHEKIYTTEEDLAQYLMFGENAEITHYKVKRGDTIESISEEYIINTQEFLIANPEYKDATSMLTVDTEVNVTLLNPVLTFIVALKRIEDIENKFMTTTKLDSSKYPTYQEITQVGISGITRTAQSVKIINGEPSQEVILLSKEVIREPVDQIVTKGSRAAYISGKYVDTGLDWGWPTNVPYIITSPFGYRWGGQMHNGVDISGTGHGSPIYAVADGMVTQAAYVCKGCSTGMWALGSYVVINHGNNIYTSYLHLSKVLVNPGAMVKKGQKIGTMGNTGRSRGTHLHFGVSEGEPYIAAGAKHMDPFKTIYK